MLSGAAQRHYLSKGHTRDYRRADRRAELAANVLLFTRETGLTQRQQLLGQQQFARKSRAVRFLGARSRLVHSVYHVKSSRNRVKSLHSARKLERKLTARRSLSVVPRQLTYRSSALIQRQTTPRISRWLELRNLRVQKKLLFDKNYLITPFPALQRSSGYRRVRRLVRQRQQPVLNTLVGSQLYPEFANVRFTEQRRRLQLKNLAGAGQKYKSMLSTVSSGGYLPEVTALTRAEGLAL